MSCPNLKNFAAWINLMPGAPSTLFVTGDVETNAGHLTPHLRARELQGINQKILILDLTVVKTGNDGTEDVYYRGVRFEAPTTQGQYTDVEITFEGNPCISVSVTETH